MNFLMRVTYRTASGVVFLLLLTLANAFGDVRINEFSSLSSDRLLRWSDSGQPRLGSGISWWENEFDDLTWPSGTAPVGFNYPDVVTDLAEEMHGLTPSLYLRQAFTVTAGQATSTADLLLDIDYDDGFIAYVNGKEFARANMGAPGGFCYADQPSFNAHDWTANETFNLGRVNALLQEGENVLAIQLHNVSISSGALMCDAGMKKTAGGTANFVSKGSDWRYFTGHVEPSGGVFDPAFLPGIDAFQPDWAKIGFDEGTWTDGDGPLGYDASADYQLGTDLDAMRYNQSVLYTRKRFHVDASQLASISTMTLTIDYDDGYVAFLNGTEIARSTNLGSAALFVPYNATASSGHNASMDSGGNNPGAIENIAVDKALLVEGENVLAIQMCNSSVNSSDLMVISDLTTNGGGGPQLVTNTEVHKYFIGTEEPAPTEDNTEAVVEPKFVDWIELHNDGASPVDLTGWSLSDSDADPRKWMFPDGTEIGAGGYLLVLADGVVPEDGESTFLHAGFKLSADGDFLGIYDATGAARTEFNPEFPKQYDFHSYGTDPGGGGGFGYLHDPTPGAANSGPFLSGRTKSPDFSEKGGFHNGAVTLDLSSTTPGATIRYTTDGSEPTATHGTEFTSAFALPPINDKTGHVIRARSFAVGMIPSKVKTHSYLVDLHPNLQTAPALIFTGDEGRSFFKEHGIMAIEGGTYVGGRWQANGIDSYNIPFNRGRAYERPIHLELYYSDGRKGVREDTGIRLSSSNYSRPRLRLTNTDASPWTSNHTEKPSFNIFFRNDYGSDAMDHQWLSEDYSVDRYAQLRVRAGKNDITNPFIIDQVMRHLYSDMGQHSSNGIINTVFINGKLKGFFNLSERLREAFFQAHHDSTEAWDVRQVGDFANGDSAKWNEMISLMQQDLTVLANYRAVQQLLDVDNLIDYLLVNIYGATRDWPQNNWVAARERSDTGLYRFYVWDAEMAFGRNGPPSYDTIQTDLINKNSDIPNIYKYLRNSPEFRLRWADRVQKHFFHGAALDDRDTANSTVRTRWDELVATHQPLLSYVHNQTLDSSKIVTWTHPSTGKRTHLFGPNNTQFANHGLWPDLRAPEFSQHGGSFPEGNTLTISDSGPPEAVIYTTTDGSDPRLPGGAIAPTASAYSNGIVIDHANSLVMARAFVPSTGEWSALNEAGFEIAIAPILVNEVLAHTDLPEVDSIELHNPGGSNVDIGGWFLTDDFSEPKKYRIPDGTTIPARGYLVFDESDFSAGPNGPNGPNGFRLSEYGEEAYLFSGDAGGDLSGYSHGWDFRASPNGVTTGRHVDSQGKVYFVLQTSNTLGAANSSPRVGPVVVSEIHYHPPDFDGGADNHIDEFIELTNTSTSTVPLYGTDTSVTGYGDEALNDTWRLRDAVDFDFPTGVELAAGERVLVVGFDPATDTARLASFRSKFSIPDSIDIYGPWTGELNNSGEEIELKYPGSADPLDSFFVPYYTMEEVDYEDSSPWPTITDGLGFSLQRFRYYGFASDPQNWKANIPQRRDTGVDTDGDGMEDSWELEHGLIVGVDDSGLDPDQDGNTNGQEFGAMTSPNDPSSYLQLSVESTETGLSLQFTAAADVAYKILYTDSMISPVNWTELQHISADSEERDLQIEIEATEPQRFFKVVVSALN